MTRPVHDVCFTRFLLSIYTNDGRIIDEISHRGIEIRIHRQNLFHPIMQPFFIIYHAQLIPFQNYNVEIRKGQRYRESRCIIMKREQIIFTY